MKKPTPVNSSKYDEYEIQDALRTIVKAQEYSKDKKMMDLIQKEAEKQKKAATNAENIAKGAK